MAIYIHCPGGVFDQYVDFPWFNANYPNVSFPRNPDPALLVPYDVFVEVPTAEPVIDPATQKVVALPPVETTPGIWEQQWGVEALTQEEQDRYTEDQRRDAAITAIKQDTEVKQLLQATPTAIDAYIDTNVTDLASAKEVIKRIARATAVTGAFIFDD